MKKTINIVAFEVIVFVVAGIITNLIGKFTLDRYGTILLACGLVTVAISAFTPVGSLFNRPDPYVYKPKASVREQHLSRGNQRYERYEESKEMKSSTSFSAQCLAVGTVPIVVGLILMHWF